VGWAKQRRIIFAARHFLARLAALPPCRFDVVALQGSAAPGEKPVLQWIRGAFDATGHG
jgi:putative endonuclease